MDSTPVILSSTNGDEEEEEEWIISKSCKNIHKQIGTKLDEEELLDLIDTGSYIHLSSSSSSYTTTATNSTSSPSSSFSSNSRKRSLSMISDEEVGELRAVDDDYGNVSSSSDGHFHFNKKSCKEKQQLIHEIIRSLHKLHFANLIQQNLHGGNILINYHEQDPPIDDGNDYGGGQHHHVSHQQKLDDNYNNIYTKSSDIYSVGIILWEIFLEQLAFYNRSHDSRLQLEISDGLRPNVVVNGIPKCFIELMKKCWDNCSKNRPTIEEVLAMLDRWHLLPDDSFLSLE
ncbi:13005_t:CDS:2, partial [Entrophospora sp. SA101]